MWARIEDTYHENPKVLSVSHAARWMHVASITWCSKYLTDGVIPRRMAWRLGAEDETSTPNQWIDELLRAGLWEKHGDDYLVHDFLEYNPSREEVLERRRATLSRKERSQQKRGGQSRASDAPRDDRGRMLESGTWPVTRTGTRSDTREERCAEPSLPLPVNPLPVNPVPGSNVKSVNASRAREVEDLHLRKPGNGADAGSGSDPPADDDAFRRDPRYVALTFDQRASRAALAAEIGDELNRLAGRLDDDVHRSAGFHRRVAFFAPELVPEALNAARDAIEDRRSGQKRLRGGPDAYFAGAVRNACEREGVDIGVAWNSSPTSSKVRSGTHRGGNRGAQ